MSKAPSMPMYWDAYLADTTHLSTEEHGAYLLLLAAMWRRNGSVPDDDKDNARILGLSLPKWRRIKQRLASFLIIDDGQISQKKLQELWQTTQEKIEKNRQNGLRGGRPTSNKSNDLAKANGSASVKRNETIPEPEPDPDKKESSNEDSQKRAKRLPDDWVLPKAWGEWAVSEGWPERLVREQAEIFKDYWLAKSGKDASKRDWQATWRNWMRRVEKPGNVTQFRKRDPRMAAIERRLDAQGY